MRQFTACLWKLEGSCTVTRSCVISESDRKPDGVGFSGRIVGRSCSASELTADLTTLRRDCRHVGPFNIINRQCRSTTMTSPCSGTRSCELPVTLRLSVYIIRRRCFLHGLAGGRRLGGNAINAMSAAKTASVTHVVVFFPCVSVADPNQKRKRTDRYLFCCPSDLRQQHSCLLINLCIYV